MVNITPIIIGTLIYIIPTFLLAYFWHLKWFKKFYEKLEYAGSNPSPPLGLSSMIVQGIIISTIYYWAPIDHTSLLQGLIVISLMAAFHWSVHVLAAMAKNNRLRNLKYFCFETLFLIIQFGIYALLISALAY